MYTPPFIPPVRPDEKPGRPVKKKALVLAALAMILLSVVGVMLVTLNQPESEKAPVVNQLALQLETPPQDKIYKVKKSMSVLGMDVLRVEHRQYPQEFVLLNGLGPELAADVLDESFGPAVAEPLINQMLKLKMPDKNVSMHVESMETLEKGELAIKDKNFPYRRLKIRFKLSTEENARVYEGVVVHRAQGESDTNQSVVVSFTRVLETPDALAYDPALLNAFLETL